MPKCKAFLWPVLGIFVAMLLAALPVIAQDAAEAEGDPAPAEPGSGDNPLDARLFMNAAPDYEAGKPLAITVRIEMPYDGNITAMGLYQTVPPGWVFQGPDQRISGLMPNVFKQQEDGTIDFAWFTIEQTFPYEFTYLVTPGEGASGPAEVIGHIEYRTDGPAYESDPASISFTGIDRTPPVITLNGAAEMSVREGASFRDPGATAIDNVDGDITAQIRTSGTVNTSSPGTYTIGYSAKDKTGNVGEASRTVVVTARSSGGGGGGGFYDPGEDIGGDSGDDSGGDNMTEGSETPAGAGGGGTPGAIVPEDAAVAKPPRTVRVPAPSEQPIRQGLLAEYPQPPAPALPPAASGNTITKRDAAPEETPGGMDDGTGATGNSIARRETGEMQTAKLWTPETAGAPAATAPVAALEEPGTVPAASRSAARAPALTPGQGIALGVLGLAVVAFGGLGWFAYRRAFRAVPRKR